MLLVMVRPARGDDDSDGDTHLLTALLAGRDLDDLDDEVVLCHLNYDSARGDHEQIRQGTSGNDDTHKEISVAFAF